MDYSTINLWTSLYPIEGVPGCSLLLLCFIEIPIFNVNSVDPDQTLHSAASDLGLHCLPMSLLWDASLKSVKKNTSSLEKKHLWHFKV